jgi:hypothetical protein
LFRFPILYSKCCLRSILSNLHFHTDSLLLPILISTGSSASTEVNIRGNDVQDALQTQTGDWSFIQVTAGTESAKAGETAVFKSPYKVYKRPYYVVPPPEGNQYLEKFWPLNFPVYTAIISVNLGLVTGITWDDGCFFCITTRCKDTTMRIVRNANETAALNPKTANRKYADYQIMTSMDADLEFSATGSTYWKSVVGSNCFQTNSFCKDQTAATMAAHQKEVDAWTAAGSDPKTKPVVPEILPCDLSVYVVFTGTDVNGRYLKSAGLRFSRFKSYSIGTLYKSASAVIQNYLVANDLA